MKKQQKGYSKNMKKSLKPKTKTQRETMQSSISNIKKTADKWVEKGGMTAMLKSKNKKA